MMINIVNRDNMIWIDKDQYEHELKAAREAGIREALGVFCRYFKGDVVMSEAMDAVGDLLEKESK